MSGKIQLWIATILIIIAAVFTYWSYSNLSKARELAGKEDQCAVQLANANTALADSKETVQGATNLLQAINQALSENGVTLTQDHVDVNGMPVFKVEKGK